MTLKNFIHSVGLVFFGLIATSAIYLDVRAIADFNLANAILGMGMLLIINIPAFLVASRGWKMFRQWNKSVLADYADLQAILTSIVIFRAAAITWPHSFNNLALGILPFFCTRGFLRHYLERHFGFSDSTDTDAGRRGSHSDVKGTPWETNSSYMRG